MSDYEFTISLRIRHPTIDPARITQSLELEPQHTWKAGDPRRDPNGEQLEGDYRESYWMGQLMDKPQLSSETLSLETVLAQALAQLRRSEVFLEQLNSSGGTSELQISLYARQNFQLELRPDLLALMGRLRVVMAVDVHLRAPPTESAESAESAAQAH
jgi:hypothetical protein